MKPEPSDRASEIMQQAHHAAEQVEMLLDRHWGDAGADPDLVNEWRDMLENLAREIRWELGEPKEKCPVSGGLVSRAPRGPFYPKPGT